MPALEDRGLELGGEEGERDARAQIGFGMAGLSDKGLQGHAGLEGLRPGARLGENPDEARVGRTPGDAGNDPGLDPPATERDGMAEGEEVRGEIRRLKSRRDTSARVFGCTSAALDDEGLGKGRGV